MNCHHPSFDAWSPNDLNRAIEAAPSSPELSFRSGRPGPAGAQRGELSGFHGNFKGILQDLMDLNGFELILIDFHGI